MIITDPICFLFTYIHSIYSTSILLVCLFWSPSINSKYLDLMSMSTWIEFKNPFRILKSYIHVTFRAIYNQNLINSNYATCFLCNFAVLNPLNNSDDCLQFFFKDISVHPVALLSSRDRFLNFILLFSLSSIHWAFSLHLSFIGTGDRKINHVESTLLSVW